MGAARHRHDGAIARATLLGTQEAVVARPRRSAPTRRTVVPSMSGSQVLPISDAVGPGRTIDTRTPVPSSSICMIRARPSRPYFAVDVGGHPGPRRGERVGGHEHDVAAVPSTIPGAIERDELLGAERGSPAPAGRSRPAASRCAVAELRVAGVGHEHLDRAERPRARDGEVLDRRRVGEVEPQRDRLAAVGADLVGDLLAAARPAGRRAPPDARRPPAPRPSPRRSRTTRR